VNLRFALTVLVLAFIAVLFVMGTVSFVRWVKLSYPRHFHAILAAIVFITVGLGLWGYMEASDRPAFHADDLITLQQPLVVRIIPTERLAIIRSCIVDIHEHLSIVEVGSGTLKARVESNTPSGPSFCDVGTEVQFELAWLHRYTLTHGHS
jgi:hypothetical protein